MVLPSFAQLFFQVRFVSVEEDRGGAFFFLFFFSFFFNERKEEGKGKGEGSANSFFPNRVPLKLDYDERISIWWPLASGDSNEFERRGAALPFWISCKTKQHSIPPPILDCTYERCTLLLLLGLIRLEQPRALIAAWFLILVSGKIEVNRRARHEPFHIFPPRIAHLLTLPLSSPPLYCSSKQRMNCKLARTAARFLCFRTHGSRPGVVV